MKIVRCIVPNLFQDGRQFIATINVEYDHLKHAPKGWMIACMLELDDNNLPLVQYSDMGCDGTINALAISDLIHERVMSPIGVFTIGRTYLTNVLYKFNDVGIL